MKQTNQLGQRESWGSRVGFIFAATGSAVGLGNIWKFSYSVGNNGGGAFVMLYLIFAALIGFTLMLAEFAIGRRNQLATVGAIKVYDKRFSFAGFLGVIVCFLIMCFYPVVGGWAISYIPRTLGGFLSTNPEGFGLIFSDFISNPVTPLIYVGIFFAINITIGLKGIKGGIEKASTILMPVLFIILIIIAIKGLTLPGATAGLVYLFKPDFSKINGGTMLAAMGQAFFSLGIGMGTMTTYGSYINKKENLASSAAYVVGLDTLVAVLAGVALFPALFAFGLEPDAGPGLVFAAMPIVFAEMGSIGTILALLFFISLPVAAITTTLSLQEVVVAYLMDEKEMERKKATWITAIANFILCVFASLSMAGIGPKLFGVGIFDVFDLFTDRILISGACMFIAIFAAWKMGKKDLEDEITNGGQKPFGMINLWFFLLKYVLPLVILVVTISGIISGFADGYGPVMITGIIIMLATIPLSKKF